MAIDVQELLQGASGESIRRQSDSSTSFLQIMDRAYLKVLVEPDTMEASAARQLIMREAPIQNTVPGS